MTSPVGLVRVDDQRSSAESGRFDSGHGTSTTATSKGADMDAKRERIFNAVGSSAVVRDV